MLEEKCLSWIFLYHSWAKYLNMNLLEEKDSSTSFFLYPSSFDGVRIIRWIVGLYHWEINQSMGARLMNDHIFNTVKGLSFSVSCLIHLHIHVLATLVFVALYDVEREHSLIAIYWHQFDSWEPLGEVKRDPLNASVAECQWRHQHSWLIGYIFNRSGT